MRCGEKSPAASKRKGVGFPLTMASLTDLLGDSPVMVAAREQLERLLRHKTDARRLPPILIQGETGTGKGLLARAIHRAGPRRDGPFVNVNCAAIPETLLEAEMFGFERGAFTDARQAKAGLLQAAHRGTIFLDEIGLLPEPLQAKLLKAIDPRRPVDGERDERDCRQHCGCTVPRTAVRPSAGRPS